MREKKKTMLAEIKTSYFSSCPKIYLYFPRLSVTKLFPCWLPQLPFFYTPSFFVPLSILSPFHIPSTTSSTVDLLPWSIITSKTFPVDDSFPSPLSLSLSPGRDHTSSLLHWVFLFGLPKQARSSSIFQVKRNTIPQTMCYHFSSLSELPG